MRSRRRRRGGRCRRGGGLRPGGSAARGRVRRRRRLAPPAQLAGVAPHERGVVIRVRGAHESASPRSLRRPSAYSRTIARSENTGRPSTSVCFTSEASMSAARPSMRARPTSGRRRWLRPPRARTARRRRRGPRADPGLRSGSSPTLQSIVARIVRCRSGRSRTGAVSRGRLCSSRSAMPLGVSMPHLRGRQFDGQRQPFEPAADVHDRADVLLGQRERGLGRRGPVDEQCDRRGLQSALERRRGPGRRCASARAPRRPARPGCAARSGWSPGSSRSARPCTAGRARARHPRSARSCRARSARVGRRARARCAPRARLRRCRGCRGCSAIVGSSSPGSSTSSSARSTCRRGTGPCVAIATSIARRLLPMPPGPMRLTTRRCRGRAVRAPGDLALAADRGRVRDRHPRNE